MRRVLTALVAVGALVAFAAAPAGAQEELGLETNILEGQPGEIVAGQVDTDDIAENCVTELEAFQARFEELITGPFAGGAAEGELFDRFFPSGDFDVENPDQVAYILTGFIVLGLGGVLGPEPAEQALPQTFVLTFADIATQEPVGEMGNFDPATGEGLVTVPDIDPGQWAVAAACVGPSFDLDVLEAAIRQTAAFLEEIGAPVVHPLEPEFLEFLVDFTGAEDELAALTAVGPTVLEPLLVPDALGAVIFCILDENGECPTDEVPGPPGDDDDRGPAEAVVIQPDFTG